MSFDIPSSWVNGSIRIAVVGAGGTGSHFVQKIALLYRTIEALDAEQRQICRISSIDIYDSKAVNSYALARGLFTSSEVGMNKAFALSSRYNLLVGKDVFNEMERDFKLVDIISYDLIVTCVDQAEIRVQIGSYCADKKSEKLWLDNGVDGSSFSVILGQLGCSCGGRLPNALDLTDLESVDDSINKKPSCSVLDALERQSPLVNDLNAGFSASLISQLLLDGKIFVNGCFTELQTLHSEPIRIDHETYLMWGYDGFSPKGLRVV